MDNINMKTINKIKFSHDTQASIGAITVFIVVV